MQKILVGVLAAVDAVVAAAVGLVAVLAPLTLLWVIEFAGDDTWAALWPATARIWQLGHLVPVHVDLGDAAPVLGIADDAAAFWVSLAPLLFAAFTLLFAARSGRRAAAAGAPEIGVAVGIVITAAIALAVTLTSSNPIADVSAWQAVLLPALIYAAGSIGGAVRHAWLDGQGLIGRLHEVLDGWGPVWREVPAIIVRGTTVVVCGVVSASALIVAALIAFRGGDVIGLFERSGADAVGAAYLTLGQLAYLPTVIAWGVAWLAGPGFAVGAGTAVSPSGISLGVVPGVPLFGIIPESTPGFLLLVALIPVALGAFAGWIARRSYAEDWAFGGEGEERFAPRIAIAVGIAVLSGAAAAVIAAASSGSMGPGRLIEVGPAPGPVALTIGLEVLAGAAILLLAPMRRPVTWDDLSDDDSYRADDPSRAG